MKFWDTSAIVPLLVEEGSSAKVDNIFKKDPLLVVWWGTSIECVSAIARLQREGKFALDEVEIIISRLNKLRETWREIQAGNKLRQIAERLLRTHALRAQDAQQLAACLIANLEHEISFVSLDQRLVQTANIEGLTTLAEN